MEQAQIFGARVDGEHQLTLGNYRLCSNPKVVAHEYW